MGGGGGRSPSPGGFGNPMRVPGPVGSVPFEPPDGGWVPVDVPAEGVGPSEVPAEGVVGLVAPEAGVVTREFAGGVPLRLPTGIFFRLATERVVRFVVVDPIRREVVERTMARLLCTGAANVRLAAVLG